MTGQISPHGSGRCSRIRRSPRPRSRISMPSIEKPAPVPGNHRNVMRRRTFLATAAATTALPVLAACTHQTRQPNRPAPTPPPGPDSVPTSFADRPTWPTAGTTDTDTVITAAHDRYLCGGARIKEALDVITGGWCPVVVDVGTLTTHAVLLDENGSWTTKEAETAGLHSMGKDPRTALTTIMMGPALLDDEYAYLTMGALILSSPSTEDPSSYDHPPEGTTCPVVVAKVRLSDASIMNVATVAEKYSTKNVESINLSFSADQSSLIMTGKGDQSPTTQPPRELHSSPPQRRGSVGRARRALYPGEPICHLYQILWSGHRLSSRNRIELEHPVPEQRRARKHWRSRPDHREGRLVLLQG